MRYRVAITLLLISSCAEDGSVEKGDFPLPCPSGWTSDNKYRCVPARGTLESLGADGSGGVVGIVSMVEGDCEPIVLAGTCIESRQRREVTINRLITVQRPDRHGDLSCIESDLTIDPVGKVRTSPFGEYLVNLQPNRYTVTVALDGCQYCQGPNVGEICRVETNAGIYTVYQILIDSALW